MHKLCVSLVARSGWQGKQRSNMMDKKLSITVCLVIAAVVLFAPASGPERCSTSKGTTPTRFSPASTGLDCCPTLRPMLPAASASSRISNRKASPASG
jgi:hypothetical protein